MHHAHTVKAALTRQLDFKVESLRTVQKVKTGLAILPTNVKETINILGKALTVAVTLGGTVEKAEE